MSQRGSEGSGERGRLPPRVRAAIGAPSREDCALLVLADLAEERSFRDAFRRHGLEVVFGDTLAELHQVLAERRPVIVVTDDRRVLRVVRSVFPPDAVTVAFVCDDSVAGEEELLAAGADILVQRPIHPLDPLGPFF